jgi:hypothetical protein
MRISLTLLTALLLAPLGALHAADFHVAPDGNDANPGTKEQPFATLDRARDAVRTIAPEQSRRVVLRGGTYYLDKPWLLTAEDCGSQAAPVVYQAAPGEEPVLSGGKPVTGWQPDAGGRWKAPAPVSDFRQLYVNDRRAIRARGGPLDHPQFVGEHGYKTPNVWMAGWRNPRDIELVYVSWWTHNRHKVQSIERPGGKDYADTVMPKPYYMGDYAHLTLVQPQFTFARTRSYAKIEFPSYVENALELLDEPGEWYLDKPSRTIFYLPRSGEDLSKAKVVVPVLETLVELRGTLDRPVRQVAFEGLTFAEAGWLQPNRSGHLDTQANFTPCPEHVAGTNAPVNYRRSPANVRVCAAAAVRFERCRFTRLGGAGLDLEFGTRDTLISGCEFDDISGSAVQIGDAGNDAHHPDDPRAILKNNAVRNCFIHDVCVEYKGGVGVFVGYTEGTVIAHNEFCRLPYTAVSLGWGWGEVDVGGKAGYQTPTVMKDNRVEFNHIHRVMQELHDGGGVYTLGDMPGTVIRGNHIHDNRGIRGGIYLDEGTGYLEVRDNVVYGVPRGINLNNFTRERNTTCSVSDNHLGEAARTRPAALAVISGAGVEAPYRNLLSR